jgi:hypothetical protein
VLLVSSKAWDLTNRVILSADLKRRTCTTTPFDLLFCEQVLAWNERTLRNSKTGQRKSFVVATKQWKPLNFLSLRLFRIERSVRRWSRSFLIHYFTRQVALLFTPPVHIHTTQQYAPTYGEDQDGLMITRRCISDLTPAASFRPGSGCSGTL